MHFRPSTVLLSLTTLTLSLAHPTILHEWESLDAKYSKTPGYPEFREGFLALVTPSHGHPVIDDASLSKEINEYFATQTALEIVPMDVKSVYQEYGKDFAEMTATSTSAVATATSTPAVTTSEGAKETGKPDDGKEEKPVEAAKSSKRVGEEKSGAQVVVGKIIVAALGAALGVAWAC